LANFKYKAILKASYDFSFACEKLVVSGFFWIFILFGHYYHSNFAHPFDSLCCNLSSDWPKFYVLNCLDVSFVVFLDNISLIQIFKAWTRFCAKYDLWVELWISSEYCYYDLILNLRFWVSSNDLYQSDRSKMILNLVNFIFVFKLECYEG